MKNYKEKISAQFMGVADLFEGEHATEGYELTEIKELYWPIWKCKQSVLAEKSVAIDRFSQVILELIRKDISSHAAICAFLGVREDSFVTMQFHFLLKNDLMEESSAKAYRLTKKGVDFLHKKQELTQLKTLNFDYFILENINYSKTGNLPTFFIPRWLIDEEQSENKQQEFGGYKVLQSNLLIKTEAVLKIAHRNQQMPSLMSVQKQRNNFATFFTSQFKQQKFYDFEGSMFKVYKHFICFLALTYRHPKMKDAIKVDIRHGKRTVIDFKTNALEQKLSRQATRYFQKNPRS